MAVSDIYDKSSQISYMQKILGNSCLWTKPERLNCIGCRHYHEIDGICTSFGLKEAETLYDAGVRVLFPNDVDTAE